MKKTSLFLILCLTGLVAISQNKYSIKESKILFFSKSSIENIQAVNKSAIGIVDPTTREFVAKVPIKSFIFDGALMQEHFNENYMESDKFPNATFKGKIEGVFDIAKDGTYPVNLVGKFEMHGVVKERTIPMNMVIKNGVISFNGEFKVKLADHNIEIPKMVAQSVAEVVDVKVSGTLEPYVKKN